MIRVRTTALVAVLAATALASTATDALAQSYPRAGWQATLSRRAHNVSGTVTIVDADTFRVDNFTYDGGGINVHFVLAALDDYATFRDNRIVTEPNFLGSPQFGSSVLVDLPAGTTFDGIEAISLWCLPAAANFGSGTFRPIPEPAALGLLSLAPLALHRRRRQG